MTDKEAKVAEFNASNYFHQCALNALGHVMAQNPTTLMLVFELPDGQVGAAAVPAVEGSCQGLGGCRLWNVVGSRNSRTWRR